MRVNNNLIGVHRFSYELHNGKIPNGVLIDHQCRNAQCVNPSHLRFANKSQNAQNVQGARADSHSGVLGVSWDAARGKWRAQVQHFGVTWCRRFDDIQDAEAAVIAKRNELFTHNDRDRIA